VVVFVAADRFSGRAVEVGEAVDAAADQDLVDRRGGQSDAVGDLDRAQSLLPPQVHDLAHEGLRDPVRGVVRCR
jgi:hypothetical protein